MTQEQHYSVLLQESVEALVVNPDGFYVDGTFGRGGHSKAILARLSDKGRLLAFDKDLDAVAEGEALAKQDQRFTIVHDSFLGLAKEIKKHGCKIDGLLMDLGVSSPQLDVAERGFSFMREGPLDMRMNTEEGVSAEQWLRETEPREMARVFKEYGEERFAKKIARVIAETREEQPLTTTTQLAELIESSVPKKENQKHPATRVFQAIRIEINKELEDLKGVLDDSLALMSPGARLVVISFHSLEDRIVKRFFKKYSQSQDYPMGVPVTHDKLKAPLKMIGRAFKAGELELQENVRSRSAVMRVAEREDLVWGE